MRILFIRHADASPNAQQDFDRELSAKGLRQVAEVAKSLEQLALGSFDIYISSSKRTVQTWNEIAQTLSVTNTVNKIDDLYNADIEVYQEIIANSNHSNLLFVGHNPGISMIASVISGGELELSTGAWVLTRKDCEFLSGSLEARFTPQENS